MEAAEARRPLEKPLPGFQTIYSAGGEPLILGMWDSRALFEAVSGGDPSYWRGRRVLDIGANSSGLSVELARAGASVLAAEPDPYKNSRAKAIEVLRDVIHRESLDLSFSDAGIFETHDLGAFDTVLCLGLVYHFRDQQFVLDYLSTLDMQDLVISNQTHPGDQLAMMNRMDPSVSVPKGFWDKYSDPLSGWHPTRPIFERMLRHAGFDQVTPLTDTSVNYPKKPIEGVTNSSYYRAVKMRSIDPIASRRVYLAR